MNRPFIIVKILNIKNKPFPEDEFKSMNDLVQSVALEKSLFPSGVCFPAQLFLILHESDQDLSKV